MRKISQKMADLNENNTKISLIPIMKDVIHCLDNVIKIDFTNSFKQEKNIISVFEELPPIFFYFDKNDLVYVKFNELYNLLWDINFTIASREALHDLSGKVFKDKYEEYKIITKNIREHFNEIIKIVKLLRLEIINRYKIELHSS